MREDVDKNYARRKANQRTKDYQEKGYTNNDMKKDYMEEHDQQKKIKVQEKIDINDKEMDYQEKVYSNYEKMNYKETAYCDDKKTKYQEKEHSDDEKEIYQEKERACREKKDFVWKEQYSEQIYGQMVKVTYAESENYPVGVEYFTENEYYAKFEIDYA